jgi:hypothetical protein
VTSIDPYEELLWHGIALASAQATGTSAIFRHLAERPERAATDLAREEASFEVIFIDGSHRLDEALTDFFLCANLCAERGIIIFDDLWMPSIQSVVSFVKTSRADFQEQSTGESNIAVFQKVGVIRVHGIISSNLPWRLNSEVRMVKRGEMAVSKPNINK